MYDHWFHHAGSQLTNVRHELDEFFWIVRHSVISPCHVLELGHQAFFFGLKWKTPWLRTISPIPVGHCQNHYGTMESGHYTAYCKNAIWYKFDDHDVSPISQGAVKTPAAYILYYMADDRIAERHR